MGKRKGKLKEADGPPPKKRPPRIVRISELKCVKRSLRKTCESQELRERIGYISIEMTKCLKIGSLNLHVSLNDLINNGTRGDIEMHFNNINTQLKSCVQNEFNDYFRGARMINDEVDGYILHPRVKQLCLMYGVSAPDIGGIGNVFNYPVQTYTRNFKTNITTHAYSRIRKFCFAINNNKSAVYRTLDYLFHENSKKIPDQAIMDAIVQELRPIHFRDGKGYFQKIDTYWYRCVPMFMYLQR